MSPLTFVGETPEREEGAVSNQLKHDWFLTGVRLRSVRGRGGGSNRIRENGESDVEKLRRPIKLQTGDVTRRSESGKTSQSRLMIASDVL